MQPLNIVKVPLAFVTASYGELPVTRHTSAHSPAVVGRMLKVKMAEDNNAKASQDQGWGQIKNKQKQTSNLCRDTAYFTSPPPYLGQDCMQ